MRAESEGYCCNVVEVPKFQFVLYDEKKIRAGFSHKHAVGIMNLWSYNLLIS